LYLKNVKDGKKTVRGTDGVRCASSRAQAENTVEVTRVPTEEALIQAGLLRGFRCLSI